MNNLPKVLDVFKEAVKGSEELQQQRDLGIDIRKIGNTLNLNKFSRKVKLANLRVRNTLDYFNVIEPDPYHND